MTLEEYESGAISCDYKTGDLVKVTRKAENNEYGWPNTWTKEMDNFIGKIHKVLRDDHLLVGVLLSNEHRDFRFPWFVLERLEIRTKTIILTSEDHVEEVLVSDKLFDLINQKKTVKMSFVTFNE